MRIRLFASLACLAAIAACSGRDEGSPADQGKATSAPAAGVGANGPPQPVRGKIVSVDGRTVVVASQGAQIPVEIAPDALFMIAASTTLSAIKPGSFIGAANVDIPGGGRAMEVRVFPPGVRIGEGQHLMDAASATRMTNGAVEAAAPIAAAAPSPGGQMTNGSVNDVRSGQDGVEIKVNFPGGVRRIQVSANTPIVELRTADRALLQPGTIIAALAMPGPDGRLVSGYITTGANGAAPPP